MKRPKDYNITVIHVFNGEGGIYASVTVWLCWEWILDLVAMFIDRQVSYMDSLSVDHHLWGFPLV